MIRKAISIPGFSINKRPCSGLTSISRISAAMPEMSPFGASQPAADQWLHKQSQTGATLSLNFSLYKALASSPFWPKTYKYDAPPAQWIYDTLADLTNCTGPSSLQCLKAADVQTLSAAALYISGSHTYNTSSYTWAPVVDVHFLDQPLSQATAKGAVNIDYGWGMYNLFEGENFIPPGLQISTSTSVLGSPPFNSSLASFQHWLHGYLPYMSEENLRRVQEFYPEVGFSEELMEYNTSYIRASLIYRDTVLACPTFWTARAAHNFSYIGEYTILPATHAADTEWVRYYLHDFHSDWHWMVNMNAVGSSVIDSKTTTLHIRRLHWSVRFVLPNWQP